PREEHRKHSSGCGFLGIKKNVEELTLSEFLKLDKERVRVRMLKMMNEQIDRFQAAACKVRDALMSLGSDTGESE
ncbi:hypothetical protein FKM82_030251, partial [Ascaphus truei]